MLGIHTDTQGLTVPVMLRFSWEVCTLHRLGSVTQLRRWGSWGAAGTPTGPLPPGLTSLNLQDQQSALSLHASQEQVEK